MVRHFIIMKYTACTAKHDIHYRYESVGSPTYVVFLLHDVNVVTCDPESVKVNMPL